MYNNEIEKHRQFMKIKSEIRGSDKYLIVGIDVGKLTHHAFFGMPAGKFLFKRFVFQNTRDGFDRLVNKIEAVRVRHKLDEIVIGVEPTANYHKPLAHFLMNKSFHVVLESGNAVKKNRELLDGRWDKNDTKDADNVADLISQG